MEVRQIQPREVHVTLRIVSSVADEQVTPFFVTGADCISTCLGRPLIGDQAWMDSAHRLTTDRPTRATNVFQTSTSDSHHQ